MQLAIPHAPRKVRLTQVPGAVGRLARDAVLGLAFVALLGAVALWAGRHFVEEQGFTSRAEEVDGTIVSTRLPPVDARVGAEATLEVLYTFQDVEHSVSGVRTFAEDAEGLGKGATVKLLVDPAAPGQPREERFARSQALRTNLVPWGVLLGLILAGIFFTREAKRLVRSEVEPLRLGALVWLTPDGPLPEEGGEVVFPAHYFRQDVKMEVRARVRPGRAPVRNGTKVLAAVVPREPGWARVIDQDLAGVLGWLR
ncbi:DUF3592 domain-containing protein [Myxococcus sp. MISCRS1]|uniref:DUF3592 domain-containing protein n=1 Tax=unclassified Myxococcus TaxID=2648731 RepID=UPI001CBAF71D|nr:MULTISPECIES: DUF3592 domain-containing protein [unclassified Myxococcus]MBZ4410705.1 DUF3592 domain-containing protein [Myxococcus sp. XM-1-1-1]MCY1003855.1 DUF3592 domain-containing protein [Myxococcus sp. MISCRS1]